MPRLLPVLLLALSSAAFAQAPDYHYAGQLVINPDSGHIRADWQISVHDPDASELSFVLNQALSDVRVSGSGVAAGSVETRTSFGRFWRIRVELQPTAPHRVINISYSGVLLPEPMANGINAIESDRVELSVDSFWFPMDERFAPSLSADLAVRIGEGWQGVSTGEVQPITDGLRILNDDPRVDIVFTLKKSFHVSRAEGFTIYDQRETRAGSEQLAATARFCLDYLNARYGREDPLPQGKLLITEREESGYARENYIVFTDISETEPTGLTRFVCHEFAHYWSTGAKFDTVDNWINEAFAEYLGLMAVREQLGQEAYDAMLAGFREQIAEEELPPVWRPGDTERGPYLVMYRKAPLLLAELELQIGEEAFTRFVAQYFVSADKGTTPVLLDTLEAVAGAEARKGFEARLGE